MSNYNWTKTDTAAVMFSAIETPQKSRLYRVDAVLKDEEVDPERLKKAVELAIKRLPGFLYRAVPGFFWPHLRQTQLPPEVKEETFRPGAMRNIGYDGRPEVEILYFKRRITVEGSHSIADGTGFSELLKTILAEYFVLGGDSYADFEGIRTNATSPDDEDCENPCIRYYNGEKIPAEANPKAAIMPMPLDTGLIKSFSGIIPIAEIKKVTSPLHVTITEFISAAMIKASFDTLTEKNGSCDEDIIISVPVNIRKTFPSHTVRNFTAEVRVVFSPDGRKEVSIEEVCKEIKGQIKEKSTKEKLQEFINTTYAKTQSPVLGPVPYPIKKAVLSNTNYKEHRNGMTNSVSNIGFVSLPKKMQEKLERYEIILGDSNLYGMPVFSGAAGLNEHMNVSFTQTCDDYTYIKKFFRILTGCDIPVRIESSQDNGYYEDGEVFEKKCPECGTELCEEYTKCPLCFSVPEKCEYRVKGIKTAPYPEKFNDDIHKKNKAKAAKLSKDFLKAYFMLK